MILRVCSSCSLVFVPTVPVDDPPLLFPWQSGTCSSCTCRWPSVSVLLAVCYLSYCTCTLISGSLVLQWQSGTFLLVYVLLALGLLTSFADIRFWVHFLRYIFSPEVTYFFYILYKYVFFHFLMVIYFFCICLVQYSCLLLFFLWLFSSFICFSK
jgi:hypothetical protein